MNSSLTPSRSQRKSHCRRYFISVYVLPRVCFTSPCLLGIRAHHIAFLALEVCSLFTFPPRLPCAGPLVYPNAVYRCVVSHPWTQTSSAYLRTRVECMAGTNVSVLSSRGLPQPSIRLK